MFCMYYIEYFQPDPFRLLACGVNQTAAELKISLVERVLLYFVFSPTHTSVVAWPISNATVSKQLVTQIYNRVLIEFFYAMVSHLHRVSKFFCAMAPSPSRCQFYSFYAMVPISIAFRRLFVWCQSPSRQQLAIYVATAPISVATQATSNYLLFTSDYSATKFFNTLFRYFFFYSAMAAAEPEIFYLFCSLFLSCMYQIYMGVQ